MREAEIDTARSRYTPRKPFPKNIVAIGYIVVLVLLLFTILTKNKTFLFLFVTSFSAIINYHTNIQTIRFNPAPEVFSSLLITRIIGFNYALYMLLIPTLLVDIYTARLDKDTFISLILTVIAAYIMSGLPGSNFVVLGLVLVTVKFILGLVLNMLMDISPQEILFEHVLGFFSNILIFTAAGRFFIGLF